MGTISTDDGKVEIIKIPRPDCTAKEGASLVVQDDDGTQGALIDDNVRINEIPKGLKVTSNRAHPDADIKAFKVRGGDKVLDSGGLTIVTSTDIECKGEESPPETTPPTTPLPVTSPPPSSSAPTTSPTPGQGAPGPDSECPGAQFVNTTTGTGDKQSPVFGITGDSFRVTTTVTGNPRFLLLTSP